LILDRLPLAGEEKLMLPPPKSVTRIRVIDFPPESEAIRQLTGADAAVLAATAV